jgi:hypothetical protein
MLLSLSAPPRVGATRFLLVALPVVLGCFSSTTGTPDGGSPSADSSLNPDVATRGNGPASCTPPNGSAPPSAPNGYYTNGASVCTAQGEVHLFHGIDRPSLEFCPESTDVDCTHLTQDDVNLMESWGANVIRVALDQDRWLPAAALYDPSYAPFLDQLIKWAEADCMDVILDLHWSDQGDLSVTSTANQGAGNSQQQPMADVNSLEFWKEVATRYRGDGHVFFELYNEPHDISWSVWLNGGTVGNVQYVGMQALYDTIRNDANADNVVIAGGVQWAFDLSGVSSNPLNGYNIMYASHVYKQSNDAQSEWYGKFGYLAQTNVAPVILTEFGDGSNNGTCTGDWDTAVIQYTNQLGISWTAWGWYVPYNSGNPPTPTQLCSFPSLISDWGGTPTVQGQVVEQALSGYPRAACSPPTSDAGSSDAAMADAGNGDAPLSDGGARDVTTADSSVIDATANDGARLEAASPDGEGSDAATADGASGDATLADGGASDAGAGESGDGVATSPDVGEGGTASVDASSDAEEGDAPLETYADDASAEAATTD